MRESFRKIVLMRKEECLLTVAISKSMMHWRIKTQSKSMKMKVTPPEMKIKKSNLLSPHIAQQIDVIEPEKRRDREDSH